MSSFTASPATPEAAQQSLFLNDVLSGLSQPQRSLPCKYFYDQRGSQLFDQICELDEYYPTRTELNIMQQFAPEMGQQIGRGAMLIEFGSGSSIKTRLLLNELPAPIAYVPVDISSEHLHATADRLADAYPQLEVLPVCADFTQDFELPTAERPETHDAVYFPGSTIGNLEPQEATKLLVRIADLCGQGGGLLIGIDLQKDVRVLEAAYNDSQRVTAEFNLNLLHRINRELGGDFQVHRFQHNAEYDSASNRIVMSLESTCRQTATVNGNRFEFERGDRICTEYSHKYAIEDFAKVASRAGLTLRQSWLDENRYFAVLHFALLS